MTKKPIEMNKIFTLLMMSFLMMTSSTSNAQCSAPVNLVASYNNNVSYFSWDAVPGATEYYFEIDWAGGGWSFGSIVVGDRLYEIAGLMQGGNFQWRVTANCGTLSAPSATAFFNTPCVAPYSLSATNISNISATLNWMQSSIINNANTGFSISYRLANTSNAWTQLTNVYNNPTATFFNLTGLAPATTYEWRVRRACSGCNSNYDYSTFTTLSCIPAGSNGSEWINLFALGSVNRTSGAEPGGYANVQTSTNLVIGSGNTGQIRAGFSSNVRNQRFSVYIDFNRNGSFEDVGEKVVSNSSINNTSIKSFTVNVPSNVTAGPTRMRVVMRRSSGTITSCITGYYGEAEDYNVDLLAASNRPISNPTTIFKPLLETIVHEALLVVPNPSNGTFNVALPLSVKAASYEVVNMSGVVVQKSSTIGTGNIKVNITHQPKGFYVLRVVDREGKIYNQKLLKS